MDPNFEVYEVTHSFFCALTAPLFFRTCPTGGKETFLMGGLTLSWNARYRYIILYINFTFADNEGEPVEQFFEHSTSQTFEAHEVAPP
jgi:hypothetical protein